MTKPIPFNDLPADVQARIGKTQHFVSIRQIILARILLNLEGQTIREAGIILRMVLAQIKR